MKQRYLFLCLFFLAVIFCNDRAAAQQSPQGEFPIGTFLSMNTRTDSVAYNRAKECGFNILVQYADDSTRGLLNNFNLVANNIDHPTDYIEFYATGFYSKWEAEESTDTEKVGIKHRCGQSLIWNDRQCWSSSGITSQPCSLVYGPHYRQEKIYKRMSSDTISYTPRFIMALDTIGVVNPDEDVCKIKVVYRYTVSQNGTWHTEDTILGEERTLKVRDFPPDGSFQTFFLSDIVTERSYKYPPEFIGDEALERLNIPNSSDPIYTESDPDNGIQFCVEWLRDDSSCILYVDYIEVYDNYGWNRFVENPGLVISEIHGKVQEFSDWDNLKYWYSQDEPYSLDAYIPMRTVDSLVRVAGGSPLITAFQPDWNILVNGDSIIPTYYRSVNPEKLMLDYYPVSFAWDNIRYEDMESTREQFQICHSLQPGFWFVAQAYGIKDSASNDWCIWRQPDPPELNAMVMLGLAHGLKGLFFWNFDSYRTERCGAPGYFRCIVDSAPDYDKLDLWYYLHDNLIPRLKGSLGITLQQLNYTGDYLQLRYQNPTDNTSPVNSGYLTLSYPNPPASTVSWHAGFFADSGYSGDNKHFMLANIYPDGQREVRLTLSPPVIGFNNYCFTDVEGSIDTTYISSLSIDLTYQAGEGKLYQVAPVIKYGGKLAYNDTVKTSGTELKDNMSVKNGVTLSVKKDVTYIVGDTITLEGTGFISGQGLLDLSQGTINTVSWSKSLFKGVNNNHPRLYLRKPDTEKCPYRISGI